MCDAAPAVTETLMLVGWRLSFDGKGESSGVFFPRAKDRAIEREACAADPATLGKIGSATANPTGSVPCVPD